MRRCSIQRRDPAAQVGRRPAVGGGIPRGRSAVVAAAGAAGAAAGMRRPTVRRAWQARLRVRRSTQRDSHAGDVITAVDGAPITTAAEFTAAVAAHNPGITLPSDTPDRPGRARQRSPSPRIRSRGAVAFEDAGRTPTAEQLAFRNAGSRRRPNDLPLHLIDAFAEAPFTGNPAAVVLLDAPRPEEWMQQGSRGDEMNGNRVPPSAGRRLRAPLVHAQQGSGPVRPRDAGQCALPLGIGPASPRRRRRGSTPEVDGSWRGVTPPGRSPLIFQ